MIVEIGGLVTAISAILSFAYACYRFGVKPLFASVKKLRTALETIVKIQDELKPNGGSSLRDAINRIEIALLFERQARRATTMTLDVGIFETNQHGECIWVNKKYSEISGQNLDDARGFGWINGIVHKDRKDLLKEWEEAISQIRTLNVEIEFASKNPFDQKEVPVITKSIIHAIPVLDLKSKLLGYVGIVSPSSN